MRIIEIKIIFWVQVLQHTPVIPGSLDAEVGGSHIYGQPWQFSETPSENLKEKNTAGDKAQW